MLDYSLWKTRARTPYKTSKWNIYIQGSHFSTTSLIQVLPRNPLKSKTCLICQAIFGQWSTCPDVPPDKIFRFLKYKGLFYKMWSQWWCISIEPIHMFHFCLWHFRFNFHSWKWKDAVLESVHGLLTWTNYHLTKNSVLLVTCCRKLKSDQNLYCLCY